MEIILFSEVQNLEVFAILILPFEGFLIPYSGILFYQIEI